MILPILADAAAASSLHLYLRSYIPSLHNGNLTDGTAADVESRQLGRGLPDRRAQPRQPVTFIALVRPQMLNALDKNVNRVALSTCTVICGTGVLFLLPALVNGFPFIYADSGTYLLLHIPQDRPIYYAIFNRFFDLRLSLWPSVVVQALLSAWVIWRFASASFALTDAPRLLSLALILTIGTSLPWIVGWIMPDIFTSLMIIAVALLCFSKYMLPGLSRIVLVLLIGAAVAVHQANLLVALWMLPAFGVCALLGWRPSKAFLHGFFASGIGLTLGVTALLLINLVSGRFGLSSSGSVFLLARMLEDGTALRYLEQVCPQRGFAVCAYLDDLKIYNSSNPYPKGSLSRYFLWSGPVEKLGWFRAEEAEASAIVHGTLSTYPVEQFRAAVANGWHQLFLFSTGTGLAPFSEEEYVSTVIHRLFSPAIYDAYRRSEQMRNAFQFKFINRIHMTVLIGSLVLVIGFLIAPGAKKQSHSYNATVLVITLIVGNAFTLGALSGPYDRYQNRVIWLVPLLAACVALERVPYPVLRKRNIV